MVFVGPLITPVFGTSGDVLLWVSKPEWAALLVLGRGICVTRSLRIVYMTECRFFTGSVQQYAIFI